MTPERPTLARASLAAASLAVASAQATPMSNAAIADFQIILWTSVGLGLVLVGVIYVMLGMDEVKDPGIYAQIVDARAAKKQS